MEFLEFFENLLEFSEKNEFWCNIFGKFSHKTEKVKKNWLLVGKFLSFLTNLLEFSGKIA